MDTHAVVSLEVKVIDAGPAGGSVGPIEPGLGTAKDKNSSSIYHL